VSFAVAISAALPGIITLFTGFPVNLHGKFYTLRMHQSVDANASQIKTGQKS
jgi:hypothetical protein